MTPNEKNKRLAELLGWTKHRLGARGELYATPPDGTWGKQITIPDYCTDLNAVHSAAMGLPADTRAAYRSRLGLAPMHEVLAHIDATAEIRVDALILTLEAQ